METLRSIKPGCNAECTHSLSKDSHSPVSSCVYSQGSFHHMLAIERRRSERSGDCFILMLVDMDNGAIGKEARELLAEELRKSIRGIDICGWYRQNSVIGIIYTEMNPSSLDESIATLHKKADQNIGQILSKHMLSSIKVEYHVFPERNNDQNPDGRAFNILFYPDATTSKSLYKNNGMKRTIDIIGSLLALFIFSPLFILIPFVIKATSRGPILFKQQRIGFNGRKFTFYKFRSMYQNNNDAIHREYVKKLIREESKGEGCEKGAAPVYKIRNDPRITPIGRFIRRTSLDEFPQFFNVLKGDMSLVGPRPPIAYEVEDYDCWHRYRLFGVKPGITGLWQVKGRSSVKFDGMVRLDIDYIKNWSLWLDIKILLKTPLAVMRCRGAY